MFFDTCTKWFRKEPFSNARRGKDSRPSSRRPVFQVEVHVSRRTLGQRFFQASPSRAADVPPSTPCVSFTGHLKEPSWRLAPPGWQPESQGLPVEGQARPSRSEPGAFPKAPPPPPHSHASAHATLRSRGPERPGLSWAGGRRWLQQYKLIDWGGGSNLGPTIGWWRTPESTLYLENSSRELSLGPQKKL